MHGQYKAEKRPERHFSAAGDSECYIYDASCHLMPLRFSVLPALTLDDGIIHCDIVEGAFDSAEFHTFISRTLDQMEPFPAPKSVIVMDNCRIHKHHSILELIEARYVYYFDLLDVY
jgi:hypothetical protein